MVGQCEMGLTLRLLYGDRGSAGLLIPDIRYHSDHGFGEGKFFVVCGSGNRDWDVIWLGSGSGLVDGRRKQATFSFEVDLLIAFVTFLYTILSGSF